MHCHELVTEKRKLINKYLPPVNYGDETTVAEGTRLSGDSQTTKGCTTEIKVSVGFGAAGALVSDDDSDGSPGTDTPVQAPNLVTSSTAFTVFEENRVHSSNSRVERLHVHQSTVPTRSSCTLRHNSGL